MSGLKSLDEFNANRREAYRRMDEELDRGCPNGIACPDCGAELFDTSPNCTLMSNPPKKDIHCPECKYRGYRIA